MGGEVSDQPQATSDAPMDTLDSNDYSSEDAEYDYVPLRLHDIMQDIDPLRPSLTCDRIKQEIEIPDERALTCLVTSFIQYALNDLHSPLLSNQMHTRRMHTKETYADIASFLRVVLPRFDDAGSKISWARIFVDQIQDMYEEKLHSLLSAGDEVLRDDIDGLAVLTSLIGCLCLRRLLGSEATLAVLRDLVNVVCDSKAQDALVLVVCSLLRHTGAILEAYPGGPAQINELMKQLAESANDLSPDVVEEVQSIQQARTEKWPHQIEAQVCVQAHPVTFAEASAEAKVMHERGKMSAERLHRWTDDLVSLSEKAHLRVTSMLSSQTLSLLSSDDVTSHLSDEEFKFCISRALGIHLCRLVIFGPDGSVL